MKRPLTAIEIVETHIVFGDSLDYARVRIVEDAGWTRWLAQAWHRVLGEPPPNYNNAIAWGDTIYFPRPIRTRAEEIEASGWGDLAWLIHEMTHVWQNQRGALGYLLRDLWSHATQGLKAYKYGGEAMLAEARAAGKTFDDFNPEQQGEIARDYFLRQKRGADVHAWEPLISDLRGANTEGG
jgi:type VI secretion system secreted protein VgrG